MKYLTRPLCLVLPLLAVFIIAQAARADLSVRFEESAPKDRFIITNGSSCEVATAFLAVDLGGSRSGLIFDTVSGGAGENVSQPLEVSDGEAFLASVPRVSDGATNVGIEVTGLKSGGRIVLTVDVDDSVPSGPRGVQMISGSEIEGAIVALDIPGEARQEAAFNDRGDVRLVLPTCG